MHFPALDSAARTERNRLRARLREHRRGLSPAERRKADHLINRRLSRLVRGARRVGAYLAADGEPSLHYWLARAEASGAEAFLPVLTRDNSLSFRRYRPGAPCRRNRFGIAEPLPRELTLTARELDLLLMPLVGFDRAGGRLGMGGGFYDRALARLHDGPQLVGIAYEGQEVAALPIAAWDVRLHAVVTPREIIRCRGRTLPAAHRAAAR